MKARVIALYLPQFHPIPENDQWWSPGFTEWTNVAKATRYWRKQYQPRIPRDLGFYDLRVSETREAQAALAKKYGIEGFCYWHYWFGNGKRLLERPFNEVLASGKPDFPFCLGWANESWKGFAHGLKNRNMLIEQTYPGRKDYEKHFEAVLPALRDKRYITVDGKPLFMIYRAFDNPTAVAEFIGVWRELAEQSGLKGIHFVGHTNDPNHPIKEIFEIGVDAVNPCRLSAFKQHKTWAIHFRNRLNRIFRGMPKTYSYAWARKWFIDPKTDFEENVYPTIVSDWDHTPRSGRHGFAFYGFSAERFREHIHEAVNTLSDKAPEHRILFLKSWNEWGEGNYVEPDTRYGHSLLQAIADEVK